MSDATWRHTGQKFGGTQKRHVAHGGLQRTTAMRMLGAVVYAARLADGTIKIGWTERFDLRLHWLKHHVQQDVELLAFRTGTYDDEQAIHASLVDSRATAADYSNAREYYEATPEVLAAVNSMRSDLGLSAVA